ncbi:MAG: C45 family autoproteolytic acyltransferase/hydrolase, partial [Limisphaerales bacterium]
IEPPKGAIPKTLATTVRVIEAEGLGTRLAGQHWEIAVQAPDQFRLSGRIAGRALMGGRAGEIVWAFAPDQQFGLIGQPGLPRFRSNPASIDTNALGPLRVPGVSREQLLLLPLLLTVEAGPAETVEDVLCHVISGRPQPQAMDALRLPPIEVKAWIRQSDLLPVRLSVADGKTRRLTLEFSDLRLDDPWPESRWAPVSQAGSKIETVARSHLLRAVQGSLGLLTLRVPTLGAANGSRQVVASEGRGRLEDHDGTRVLFLSGTPEEMGHQHGLLVGRQVRDLVEKILYGIGVGSSFEKGRWFMGEIENCQSRIEPFIDLRHLREMDALALAAKLEPEEIRLANFFPELFHCSGFAVFGKATTDGHLYHGRILDYLKGVGLEPNAMVIVHQPDQGHAWVNIGYAGFVGSVTAMNSRRISIGEMGGRGEGNWDGKPMAQLIREVMEKASTLDQAVAIMRRGPRTCEYYYVIADGNTRQAVGIAATPTTFEVVKPGESHARLPHAIDDAVLLSAGDRYEELARRVQANHGKLDNEGARRLMDRPVAMNSNIHSVLFAPETLDFWVANADSKSVASHCRYTHYNLGELLKPLPPEVARE